jgi:hypothetical protein
MPFVGQFEVEHRVMIQTLHSLLYNLAHSALKVNVHAAGKQNL